MRRRREGPQRRVRPDRAPPLSDLFEKIDLLSLDAGNTVVFLDHARLEKIARGLGHDVSAAKLIETEGMSKRALGGDGATLEIEWADAKERGARGWGIVMATMFDAAGIARGDLSRLLEALWASHVEHNLYSVVPEGFAEAMTEVRARGVKIAITSNSEGRLDELFEKLGILSCFDAIVDSAKVGVEKPDARIFEIACKRTGTTPEHALHLGDTMATDIIGARNAKMRCVMIDPFGHYEGMYPDVPRAEGVVEVARQIMKAR